MLYSASFAAVMVKINLSDDINVFTGVDFEYTVVSLEWLTAGDSSPSLHTPGELQKRVIHIAIRIWCVSAELKVKYRKGKESFLVETRLSVYD